MYRVGVEKSRRYVCYSRNNRGSGSRDGLIMLGKGLSKSACRHGLQPALAHVYKDHCRRSHSETDSDGQCARV